MGYCIFREGSAMKRLPILALSAVLLAAWPVPSEAAANKEHLQIMADIRMLQEQTQQLQLLLGGLAETLKTVTAKLDAQADLNRKGFADQKLLVDNVADGVRVLRERLDDNNVRLSSLTQEVDALRQSIPPPAPAAPASADQTPATPGAPAGETSGGTAAAPAPAGSGAPPEPAPAAGAPPSVLAGTTPQRLYDEAYGDYTAGRFGLAVTGFETYIKTFPRSELSDDAQLNIGAALQLEGKYQEAVTAFDKVIVNYPGSNSVPQALYKRGACYEALQQVERARQSYQQVIKNFPDSDASFLAKQALERLSKQD
jgi:tol-pal system protein YbgF